MRVLVGKGRRVSLLLALERSRGLLFHEDLYDRTATIRAKAKMDRHKVEDISGLLVSQDKGGVTIANSLDT